MFDLEARPDNAVALAIAKDHFGTAARVERFSTGLQNFVFDAISESGAKAVVRISRRQDVAVVEDALYWSKRLRPLGVPLPEVLQADTGLQRYPFPYMILERVPGRDLAFVIKRFSSDELRALAEQLAAVQDRVSSLPDGSGYGFAPRLDGPFAHCQWQAVVKASLQRSRRRLQASGVVDGGHADRAERAGEAFSAYFQSIPATPFLHDITTKNVIVVDGRLSGIVDVDDLCFRDVFFLLGLIRMALLAHGEAECYADAWLDVLRPDDLQRAALDYYTALFCLDFLSEIGQTFNRQEPLSVERAYVARLLGLLGRYLPV